MVLSWCLRVAQSSQGTCPALALPKGPLFAENLKKDPLCALQPFGCIEPHFGPLRPQHASLGLHVQASLSFLLCSYTPSQETPPPEYHRGRKVIRQGHECQALPGESGQTSRSYSRAQLSLEVPACFPCILLALHPCCVLSPHLPPPQAGSVPNNLFTHCHCPGCPYPQPPSCRLYTQV